MKLEVQSRPFRPLSCNLANRINLPDYGIQKIKRKMRHYVFLHDLTGQDSAIPWFMRSAHPLKNQALYTVGFLQI